MAETAEPRLESALKILEEIAETGGYLKREMKDAMIKAVSDIRICFNEANTDKIKENSQGEDNEQAMQKGEGDDSCAEGQVAPSVESVEKVASNDSHRPTSTDQTVDFKDRELLTEADLEERITNTVTKRLQVMMENLSNSIMKMIKDETKSKAPTTLKQDQKPEMATQASLAHPARNYNDAVAGRSDGPSNMRGIEEDLTEDGFEIVKRRALKPNRKTRITIGTDDTTDLTLQAGERTAWLYVGRLSHQTTGTNLKEFLRKKGIELNNVSCEELRTSGLNKAFKVGIPYQYLEQTEEATFWPKGILVRPFRAPIRRYHGGADLD